MNSTRRSVTEFYEWVAIERRRRERIQEIQAFSLNIIVPTFAILVIVLLEAIL